MDSDIPTEATQTEVEFQEIKDDIIATKAQDLTSRVLQFLSTASNETLGACLIGLGASTYLILGRIGLVLIGVVGGIVLHATWESNIQSGVDDEFSAAEIRRRREVGLDVAKRVLDWRGRKQENPQSDAGEELDINFMMSAQKQLDFRDFQPATGAALTSLTDAVIRDYVKYAM